MAHEIVVDGARKIISNDAPVLLPGTYILDLAANEAVEVTSDLWQNQQDATVFPSDPPGTPGPF